MRNTKKLAAILSFIITSVYVQAQLPDSVLPVPGYIIDLLGNGSSNPGQVPKPVSPVLDSQGNLYFITGSVVYKLTASDLAVTAVAGNGLPTGESTSNCAQAINTIGDGCPATQVAFAYPNSVAVDASGNIYIADQWFNRIRKVTASTGIITTIAGSGTASASAGTVTCDNVQNGQSASFGGDGGAATAALLACPMGVAVDASGNIFIADTYNNRVRKVTSGIITTVAGKGPAAAGIVANCGALGICCLRSQAFSGDSGPATGAQMTCPFGIAVQGGNIFIADTYNNRIRKVSGGIINTIAGNGNQGYSGDGGPATSAMLNGVTNVSVDISGNVYFADYNEQYIREISFTNGFEIPFGYIQTIAGGGSGCSGETDNLGDGCPTLSAILNQPSGVVVDSNGFLYIADYGHNVIRVGSPYNSNGDGIGGTCGVGCPGVPGSGTGVGTGGGGVDTPTLPQWAAIVMGVMLVLIAVVKMRKQQSSAIPA